MKAEGKAVRGGRSGRAGKGAKGESTVMHTDKNASSDTITCEC